MGQIWILCGPLASGKSTVAAFFAEAGAVVLDADQLVDDLLEESTVVKSDLRDAFGDEIFDELDRPDREAISRQVFADPAARARLEGILHPRVLERLEEEARAFREKPGGLLLLEVVLWMKLDPPPFPVDGICLTEAPEKVLLDRAVARGGLDEPAARSRLSAQAGWENWNKRADVTLNTDQPKEALRETVLSYYRAWTQSDEGSRE
jgi:dephospho-CoA kinase